tara:strand:- start:1414 stop:1584 length:171 start_codon:yes stop_codon:yes gene_type:complete
MGLIIEQILGSIWLITCIVVLGFGISSYFSNLSRGDNNKIMDNIKKLENNEKKYKK